MTRVVPGLLLRLGVGGVAVAIALAAALHLGAAAQQVLAKGHIVGMG